MSMRNVTALALAAMLAGGIARAQDQDQDQEETRLSPALEQLRETVADRLESAADRLGLTAEQREKIRQVHAGYAEKYRAQRDARRALRREEFQALGAALTPEQRDQVKDAVEERAVMIKEGTAKRKWPEVAGLRDSIADRLESAADELGLSDEQREKIRESHRPFAQKYREQRAEHRELVEDELKAVGAVLTPEQREMARRYVAGRVVRAAAARSIADRLQAAADKLGLTADQRSKIGEAREPYADKFRDLRRARRALLGEEMRAIAAVLTPEQREQARDYREDRVVVIGVESRLGRSPDRRAAARDGRRPARVGGRRAGPVRRAAGEDPPDPRRLRREVPGPARRPPRPAPRGVQGPRRRPHPRAARPDQGRRRGA